MNKLLLARKMGVFELIARLLTGCAAGHAPARPSDVQRVDGQTAQFGQWAVGCSNLGSCTALAAVRSETDGNVRVYIRIIFLNQSQNPHSIIIHSNGAPIARFGSIEATKLTQDLIGSVDAAVLLPVFEANYRVPTTGFGEAIDAIKSWQLLPPKSPSDTPVITPFPGQIIDETPLPNWIAGTAENCPDGQIGDETKLWRGVGGSLLWRIACANEGLNVPSVWYYANGPIAQPTPIQFLDGNRPITPFNSDFEAENGLLTMTHYFGGQYSYSFEDCGIYRAYGWTTEGLKLVETRSMPFCGTGIDPDNWITTFHATLLIGTNRP